MSVYSNYSNFSYFAKFFFIKRPMQAVQTKKQMVSSEGGVTKEHVGLNFISLYKYTIAKITSTKMNSYKFYTKGIQKKVY